MEDNANSVVTMKPRIRRYSIAIREDFPWSQFMRELWRMRVLPDALAFVDHGTLYINITKEGWWCNTTIKVSKRLGPKRIEVKLSEGDWSSHRSAEEIRHLESMDLDSHIAICLNKMLDAIVRLVHSHKPWERRDWTKSG